MNESEAEKRHQELRRSLATPEGYILLWAFNYASMSHEDVRRQFPQIAGWPNGSMLGNLLQAGTILAAILQIERHLGPRDYTALHKDLVEQIDPSVRQSYLPSLQGLACFLLQADRSSLATEEIPALTKLLTVDEVKLANSIGLWLILTLKNVKNVSDPLDIKIASVLANLVYNTYGRMITQNILDKKSVVIPKAGIGKK